MGKDGPIVLTLLTVLVVVMCRHVGRFALNCLAAVIIRGRIFGAACFAAGPEGSARGVERLRRRRRRQPSASAVARARGSP